MVIRPPPDRRWAKITYLLEHQEMSIMKCWTRFGWGAALTLLAALTAQAEEPKVTVVLEGLDNPSGLVIQPETGAVFVSDSGAARVIRVSDGQAHDVITGFTLDVYGKGPMYNIGPLGLAFLDKNTLVVGDGGKLDGEELLRIYTLPEDGSAMACDQMKASFTLAGNDEIKGEGNFYALAVNKSGIYVTCNGDDTKGWVARCAVNGDQFGPYERFIATKEAVNVDAPVGITMDSSGNVVVGQMGEINVPNDSLLSFYNAQSGKLLAYFETGLHDIAALAYHPKTGRLYAVDFAWLDVTQGGLFELVAAKKDDKPAATASKVMSLMKPTAMAFDADGALYVTVMGEAKEGDAAKPGKLLKIEF
jgi:DNA-binding beta-propeller fold protein YncE